MNDVPVAGIDTLLHAAAVVQAHVESQLSRLGLSLPKLAALRVLRDAGESLALGQLAERLSCVKSNITQLVDRLEADGFVSRAHDPDDRRSRLAVLTDAGRRVCDEGSRIRRDAEGQLFASLSADEVRQLQRLIGKVTDSTRGGTLPPVP
jgi:DNA-binding MarR family transcriptional regulator